MNNANPISTMSTSIGVAPLSVIILFTLPVVLAFWEGVPGQDSNLRSFTQRILSPPPLIAWEKQTLLDADLR